MGLDDLHAESRDKMGNDFSPNLQGDMQQTGYTTHTEKIHYT